MIYEQLSNNGSLFCTFHNLVISHKDREISNGYMWISYTLYYSEFIFMYN